MRGEVCRPEGGGARARGAVAGASGVDTEDPRLEDWGGRARAVRQRTMNMSAMFVTLDVSKLSGWLKADACCQVESRACVTGRGAERVIGRLGADTGGQESGRSAQEECGLWFQVEARIAPRTWLSCP